MSLSSSIFQKACPDCAASVAVSLMRCDCGHVFESDSKSQSPLETTLRDEELYEGYLAARAEQARQAAYAAELALAEDMDNPEFISAATLAREVAKSIDSDLAVQQKKIAVLRNVLRNQKPVVTASTAKKNSAPQHRPVAASPAVPAPAISASTISIGVVKTNPVAAAASPAKAPVWHATATQKVAGVLAALKNAKARENIVHTKPAPAAAEPILQVPAPAPVVVSNHGAALPTAFRKEQASRAEKIMEARKTIDGKECPNCTSSVPVSTTRCQCGFTFVSSGTELPSLTLCTGDFTALRNSLKLNLR